MFTAERPTQPERLTARRLVPAGGRDSFARDVLAGLSARQKALPPKYFYDELGSRLFEAICCLPEYYVTRAENEIIAERAGEIVASFGARDDSPVRLVELGSGSAEKTRPIIESLLRRGAAPHYLPVDISPSSLARSARELLAAYAALRVTTYEADYTSALRELRAETAGEGAGAARTVVLFFGSSIGNLDPAESRALLGEVRSILGAGDALLLGADLKKSAAVLVPAYDDALGVTAAFNLNLLARINRELGGDFDLRKFEHRALYDERLGRVEMHLVSREAHTVRIGAVDLEVGFGRGETIHTENSYKFDAEDLRALAADTGFELKQTWLDGRRRFSLNLFSVA